VSPLDALTPTAPLDRVRALFVSPHLDDVALSCGGTVHAHAAADDRALIVTLFTEGPDPTQPLSPAAQRLHDRAGIRDVAGYWQRRREEDAAAVEVLGADRLWLGRRDALYREGPEDAVPGHRWRPDPTLRAQLGEALVALWRQTDRALVYVPIGVAWHVDHRLAYLTARPLRDAGATVWLYEDFPYVVKDPRLLSDRIAVLGCEADPRTVDVTAHFARRLSAIACYASQLSEVFGPYGPFEEVTRRWAGAIVSAPGAFGERFWRLPPATPKETNDLSHGRPPDR
jgi:LmbE family N-acetylglucosaminyl deacetylase